MVTLPNPSGFARVTKVVRVEKTLAPHAMLVLVPSHPKLEVNPSYCKGCLLCTIVCPRRLYEPFQDMSELGYPMPRMIDTTRCIDFPNMTENRPCQCMLCILTCPDQAIRWRQDGAEVECK